MVIHLGGKMNRSSGFCLAAFKAGNGDNHYWYPKAGG
jgi:hypothetical protein